VSPPQNEARWRAGEEEAMTSPEIIIRIHAYPSRRRRPLLDLLPEAFAVLGLSVFILTVLANA